MIFHEKIDLFLYDKSNFAFQTFVLASATAGTTVSATNTAAGSQIGKQKFLLVNQLLF